MFGMLLILFDVDYMILLCCVFDVCVVCEEVYGFGGVLLVVLLCELFGFVGVYEWCKKGVLILVFGGVLIYLYYGVFLLVCGEYVEFVVCVLLLVMLFVFDIGMGIGVLVVVFVLCGVEYIVVID